MHVTEDWPVYVSRPRRTMRLRYPCCRREMRLTRIAEVPRERYARKCHECKRAWDVSVEVIGKTAFALIERVEMEG